MTVQYDPVGHEGGRVPSLPYRLDPPITDTQQDTMKSAIKSKTNGSFFNLINKKTLFIAVFLNALILHLTTGPQSQNIVTTGISALFFYFLLTRILNGGFFKILILGFISLIVLSMWPTGVTSLSFIILILTVIQGFRTKVTRYDNHFGKGENGLATLDESIRETWGVAGGHIGNNSEFGSAGVAGAKGEQVFGEALTKLTKEFPFVRVFHGLCFTPGRPGADIDHIVLIGKKVFLLDSKNWSYGQYDWHFDGTIIRDGSPFSGGEVHMDSAVDKWRIYLGRDASRVLSRIVMTKREPSNYGMYSISNARAPRNDVLLSTIKSTIEELREVARNSEPVVDRRLVYKVFTQLQD